MTRTFLLSGTFALLLASSGCPTGGEQARVASWSGGSRPVVSFAYFRSSLSLYGRWFDDPTYGGCWTPDDVDSDWRPYRDGCWAATDVGWTWVGDEPWSWATDHYGRWRDDPVIGWVWVPGTVWSPAWVAWREGEDWIGWAPLPIESRERAGTRSSLDEIARVPPREWNFVRAGRFTQRELGGVVEPRSRNGGLIGRTRIATAAHREDAPGFLRGPTREHIEAHQMEPIPRVRIRDLQSPDHAYLPFAVHDGTVPLFRPDVRADRLAPSVRKRAGPGGGPRPWRMRFGPGATAGPPRHGHHPGGGREADG